MIKSRGFKIGDSNPEITLGSRADDWWKRSGYNEYFKKVRPGLNMPKGFKTNDLDFVVKKFKLKGVGFGNWVTIEDRINYTYSLVLALYDLNKILRFKYNIGFGLLGVAFGARGRGGALAHYEPGTDIINITRYKDGPFSKERRFFGSGGLGSLAHEYGHFLDYFAGGYLAKTNQYYSLSNGRSVSKSRTITGNKMRDSMDAILEAIIWEKKGKELSSYYKRLINTIGDSEFGEYWIRRNELFARAFEVYVLNKLRKQAVKNYLLTSQKYNTALYLRDSEMEKIIPLFDKLLDEIRLKIK